MGVEQFPLKCSEEFHHESTKGSINLRKWEEENEETTQKKY